MRKLFLLEDDLSLISGLTSAFKKQGFALDTARTLAEAEALWSDRKYDLLVLDVSLPDDDTVSRESHALVTYDVKHNTFSLSPGQGRGITYCNDEQVEMVHPLKAYDIIEVGKSRLLFLPLCSEQFQWSEE